jgi:outer membrane protein
MKKFTLFYLFCAIAIGSSAQLVKGTKMIGGGLTYSSTTEPYYINEDITTTSFEIMPGFGYFISDGFAVGLNVGYSSGKQKYINVETKSSEFSVGPFARYYKQTSNENFAIYGQFSFLFGSGKQDNGNTDVKSSSMDISVSPGLAYFFNQHWAVELGFRGIGYYTSDPNKDADNNETTNFEVGLNSLMPASLGFRYHF